MSAARMDITINKGSLFRFSLQLIDETTANPIDLTGKTAQFTILSKNVQTLIASGVCTITEPLVGKVEITMSSATTATITQIGKSDDPFYVSEDYIYHFDIVDGAGEPERYLNGIVSVQR